CLDGLIYCNTDTGNFKCPVDTVWIVFLNICNRILIPGIDSMCRPYFLRLLKALITEVEYKDVFRTRSTGGNDCQQSDRPCAEYGNRVTELHFGFSDCLKRNCRRLHQCTKFE